METGTRVAVWAVGLSLLVVAGCGSVRSVTSTVTSIVPGVEKKAGDKLKVGEKLQLKVSPEIALMLFRSVAEENGWEVKSVGDQRNIEGAVTGKFFRIETVQFVGGRRVMTGVFFSDKADEDVSHVTLGKPGSEDMYGLPIALADKMRAAVAEWTGEDALDVAETDSELTPLDEALQGEPSRPEAWRAELEAESDEISPGLDDDFGAELGESDLTSLDDGLDPEVSSAVEDVELSPEEEELIKAIDLGP